MTAPPLKEITNELNATIEPSIGRSRDRPSIEGTARIKSSAGKPFIGRSRDRPSIEGGAMHSIQRDTYVIGRSRDRPSIEGNVICGNSRSPTPSGGHVTAPPLKEQQPKPTTQTPAFIGRSRDRPSIEGPADRGCPNRAFRHRAVT